MNKADLKAKWEEYCDIDKLVDDTMSLLTKYHHRNTEHGVCKMLDKYFENKRNLIEMLKTSPNYIGDMRIVFDIELERDNSRNEVYSFCSSFFEKIKARDLLIKTVDENGKTRADYAKVGVSKISVKDLLDESIVNKLKASNENASKFNLAGELLESVDAYCELNRFFYGKMSRNYEPTLYDNIAEDAASLPIPVKLAAGMKTSRAFNRVCATYGIDKAKKYNKLFAEYADMVSGLKRKLKFFISVNPLDYLTMSFGVSWASCHTIDRTNMRRMPNNYSGAYCGGTLSYMLDKTSFITYVHNTMPESVEDGKLYRTMFHFENDLLVQGRIYPQGNDGATDLYKTFRNFVQDELKKILPYDDITWVKKSGGCGSNTCSVGVHYKDYQYNSGCNMSYVKGIADLCNLVHIGHTRICPYCGEEINNDYNTGVLGHGNCSVEDE